MKMKKITSEKYKIKAELLAESPVHIVRFSDGEKQVKIGLPISCYDEELEEYAKKTVDSYFEQKGVHGELAQPMLHNWYLQIHQFIEGEYIIAHGIVSGHSSLQDSKFIHTSAVREFYIDEDAGNMVVSTQNTVYFCPLALCNFRKQANYRDALPDFDYIKEKYEKEAPRPEIEPGSVLLVISDQCEYYFHSLYYRKEGKTDAEDYQASPHIGTFQDSFLIHVKDSKIDLRYFPHYGNIEFYAELTDGNPFYIENVGTGKLYARTRVGTIELNAGERKKVEKVSVMAEVPFLLGGDLYPAGFISVQLINRL